jgi:hypothetical protein
MLRTDSLEAVSGTSSIVERVHDPTPTQQPPAQSTFLLPSGNQPVYNLGTYNIRQDESLDAPYIPTLDRQSSQIAAASQSASDFARVRPKDWDLTDRQRYQCENGLPSWIRLARKISLRHPSKSTGPEHGNAALALRRLFEEMSLLLYKSSHRSLGSTKITVSDKDFDGGD